MDNKMFEKYSFYFLLVLSIFPIVCIDFWVTGDSPCHLYNSKIISDWLVHGEGEFYKPFLLFNEHIEPNWITNIIQVVLLNILNVEWADKIFFALYIIAYFLGFRFLVMQINPKSAFISTVGSLLYFNQLLVMGFTNNSWSFAIWFWTLGFWLKYIESQRLLHCLGIAISLFILYLSHPMGFSFCIISIACVSFFYGVFACKSNKLKDVFYAWRNLTVKFLLSGFASIVLFLNFYMRRNDISASGDVLSNKAIWDNLRKLQMAVSLSSKERDIIQSLAILIGMLFLIAIYFRIKQRRFHQFDGLFLVLLISVFFVFNVANAFAGGLEVSTRLSLTTYLCVLFWLATANYSPIIQTVTSISTIIIALCLTAVRLPIQIEASKFAAEVMSTKDYINPKSTLLVLNYDWGGQTSDGRTIANRTWLFRHIDCYLGTQKPLIISDNYELNMWYFPLIERNEKNMYKHTTIEGMNFDERPPRADILNYRKRTGGSNDIDYVLLLSFRQEFANHPYTKEVFAQLDSAYQQVFKSVSNRSILYKRK